MSLPMTWMSDGQPLTSIFSRLTQGNPMEERYTVSASIQTYIVCESSSGTGIPHDSLELGRETERS